MKMHQDHVVPLSEPALAILDKMRDGSQRDLIFPNPDDEMFSENAMLAVLNRLGYYHVTGAEGFIDVRPRRGAIVSVPPPIGLFEMFATMAEIESACGRLAAAGSRQRATRQWKPRIVRARWPRTDGTVSNTTPTITIFTKRSTARAATHFPNCRSRRSLAAMFESDESWPPPCGGTGPSTRRALLLSKNSVDEGASWQYSENNFTEV
jgi:hypothetical protein